MMKIQKNVFCIGHVSIDILISRKMLNSIELGGSISSSDIKLAPGGVAANVSYWLGKLNTSVNFFGMVGNDFEAKIIKNDLESVGVNHILKTSKYPSALILSVIEPNGERSFIINGKSQDDLYWKDLPLETIMDSSAFYCSAYIIQRSPIRETVMKLIKYIKETNQNFPEILFNLAAHTAISGHRDSLLNSILPFVDILVGNCEEYSKLLFDNIKNRKIELLISKIRLDYPQIKIILITDGPNGCYFYSIQEEGHIEAPKVKVLDTTGAGDAFCAGFLSKYLQGYNLKKAVNFGVELGTSVCQGYGARFTTDSVLKSDFV